MAKITYYNPESGTNADGITIDTTWPPEVQRMQKELAVKNGFLPLVDIGEKKNTPFEASYAKIIQENDASGNPVWKRFWISKKIRIDLSMNKMLDWFRKKNKLKDFMERVYSNTALSDWWFNDRTFQKGTLEGKKLQDLMGLSAEEMEDIALTCREKRRKAQNDNEID